MSSARILLQKYCFVFETTFDVYTLQYMGHVAGLVRSRINGLQPFESTIEQTTETMSLSPKTTTAATMTTNLRIKSLRELLQYLNISRCR